MTYVPGTGSPRAKLMLIGEAPGKAEEQYGYPFAGPTGKIVNDLIRGTGLKREDLYLTNVVKIRPPDNKLARLKELGKSVEDFIPQLQEEVSTINPNCILAIGDLALKVLTGNSGIKKWRGSILQGFWGPKVVPTIHPASILHGEVAGGAMSWSDLIYIQEDFKRAALESKTKEFHLPDRLLSIAYNSLDLYRFLDRYKDSIHIAYDIEAFKTLPTCISLAFNSYEAISIPLINVSDNFIMQPHDLVQIWKTIIEFIHDTKLKTIGQNLKYDQVKLKEQCRINFPDPFFDVILAFHAIYPELPRGLAFITSLLTREPYYKDEYREFDPKKDKPERIFLYNAKDSAVTFECFEVLSKELKEYELEDFFYNHVMPLHALYRDIEQTGILVDKEITKKLKKKYEEMADIRDKELEELIGSEINVNSPKQVHILLYGELGIPLRKDVGEETLVALRNNVVKDVKKKRIIELILETRKVKKTSSTYIGAKPSQDGRMRTSYFIVGTRTGRSSTQKRKPPEELEAEGIPFQVLTKHGEIGPEIRSAYVVDKGYVFVEGDLSQSQARIVALLAKDNYALDCFAKYDKTKDISYDIHRVTAGWLFNIDPKEVTKEQRQLGKPVRHAGNFDMGKHRLSQMADMSEWRANKLLETFHKKSPNIRNIFHKEVQECLSHNRILIDPYGARREFYNKFGDELFKEAYAHIPQSAEIRHLRYAMRRIKFATDCRFVIEAHDSFTALVWHNDLSEFVRISQIFMETPIDFAKCSLPRGKLIIPAEFKVGEKNLQEMVDYA